MESTEQAIADSVRAREISIEAAKRQTAPLVRKGWTTIFAGWLIPAIPVVGLVGFAIAFFGGLIAGSVAISRGNSRDGIFLIFAGWLGTLIVALAWSLIYLLLGGSLLL